MTKDINSTDDIGVEFQDNRQEQLFKLAQIGLQAQQFLDTEAGRLVLDKMQEEIDGCALSLLIETDIDVIRELQKKADIARKAVQWLLETIQNGDIAYEQLKE